MAKRLIKWTLDGSILKVSKHLEDPKAVAVIEAEFDLLKLYPTYNEMTQVQQYGIHYGIKQILSDTGASENVSESKIKNAKDRWQELLDGKITGVRINATGAAENKKTLNAIKEASKVVSMEGLIIKKAMSALPGQEPFTEEDEKKLEELMEVAVHAAKRKNGKA
jgi:hypothetical protein